MEMTFMGYINNPMGRNNAVFSNREMFRNLYKEKLASILLREAGQVKYTLYTNGDKYYIHMLIPSEVVPEFYYNTVVEFYTNDSAAKASKDLRAYNVKFFSNDPSFVYTFAHAFLANDLFIRDLIPRMSKEAVLKVATEKNPSNQTGYVKSIFFLYLLSEKYNLFDKISFEMYAKPYNRKALLDSITHSDDKIKSRQIEGAKVSKNKTKDSKDEKALFKKEKNSVSKAASSVQTISFTKSAKRSPTTKGIKRI